MYMRDYLMETFAFNDATNKRLLKKIETIPDKKECIKFFSHLINCQYKWMARVTNDPQAIQMSWWDPVYEVNELESEWDNSLKAWIDYIKQKSENELSSDVIFTGFDGARWAATPKDIALQLNYHSIHHRAQMQIILRQQGVEPDFVDYIGTRYRRLE